MRNYGKTVRDFGLGVVTVAGLWGAIVLTPPSEQVVGSKSRHPQWPKVSKEFVRKNPECAVCGQRDQVQAHHVIPFSQDATGDEDGDGIVNELDEDNLIPLCVTGPGHMNCHLIFGHLGNFQSKGNPNVREDAKRVRAMLKSIKF